jgi:hypothetical protein
MKSKGKQKEFALTQGKDVSSSTSLSETVSTARVVAEKTDKKIQEGLTKATASTGTPVEDLHGGAKFMAQLSNIGGGSVDTGGGGVKDGFNTITQNTSAKSVLKTVQLKQDHNKAIGNTNND